MKFKKGDTVKVIKIIGEYTKEYTKKFKKRIGYVGKIWRIDNVVPFPVWLNDCQCYMEDELELVDEVDRCQYDELLDVVEKVKKAKDGEIIPVTKKEMKQLGNEKALHFSEGKLPVQLVPAEAIEAIAHRLQMGINKGYPANNWRKGLNYTEILGSIFRHLYAFQKGETIDIDDKTGIEQPHLWGTICCLAFLITYEAHPDIYKSFDDRYLYQEKKDG